MHRLLLLFAHPAFDVSRVHRALLAAARDVSGITVHDLYERYPDFDVDVAEEQRLLREHDTIVMQFPIYWYATPPLLKQWQDLVLTHGWAYGRDGTALRGKRLLCAVSSGGGQQAYSLDGFNRVPLRQYLLPIEATARLCGLDYLAPFVVHGSHRLQSAEIAAAATDYRAVLEAIQDDRLQIEEARRATTLTPDLLRAATDGRDV
jgi:glutathione-regulated potassium-efflux system ancillary protein KefG